MAAEAQAVRSNQRAYNTVFSSEVDLQGFESTNEPAHVVIRFGTVPSRLEAATGEGIFWSANDYEVLIDTPGIARYHVARGCQITVDALSDAGRLDTFLAGVPIGSCLMQRGLTVLHGAAIDMGFGALVFAGRNGSGKSSIVAALALAGEGRPLCDNLAVVESSLSRTMIRPGPSSFRLWEDMAAALGLDILATPRVRSDINKFMFSTGAPVGPAAEVHAIVCVEPVDAANPQLVKLGTLEATAAVMRSHFRGKLARMFAENALSSAARIAEAAPVYRLQRPIYGCGPRELAHFVASKLP